MLGFFCLIAGLVVSVVACCFFAAACRKQDGGFREKVGQVCLLASAGLVIFASGQLLQLLLTNRFDFLYVFRYSAVSLPFIYKISAFWAGQEGSLLLWLMFHAVAGLCFVRQRVGPAVMLLQCFLQSMLLLLVCFHSPFMRVTPTQSDGMGLNPLLQNPWMAIHPPLIFMGYAGIAAVFSLAVGALLRNDLAWPRQSAPWIIGGWCILGAGIFLGGFWAYEVLGWGGYWAWDPVENASFVPWLILGGLVHAELATRLWSAGIRAAFTAAIFAWLMVLYGTFLTRSGLLSDFSVHAFPPEGLAGLLAVFVLLTSLISLPLLVRIWDNVPYSEIQPSGKGRLLLLTCAAVLFTCWSSVVFVGMSIPLVTTVVGNPASVSQQYFNLASLPLALAMTALLGQNPESRGWSKMMQGAKAGLVGMGACMALSFTQPMLVVGGAICAAALWRSLCQVVSRPSAGLAHAGVAVAIFGVLASSMAAQTEPILLHKGDPITVLKHTVTYHGERESDQKGIVREFLVESSGQQLKLISGAVRNSPTGQVVIEPAILRGFFYDLYIAAEDSEDPGAALHAQISRKPFVSLVWFGCVLMTFGIGAACYLRIRTVGRFLSKEPQANI